MLLELLVTLIRGVGTRAGREERFLGRIDEPPHPEKIALICEKAMRGEYPEAQAVFSSPLTRCVESARVIYPNSEIIVDEQLAAFNYGIFSGMNYSDIIKHGQFEQWAKTRT